MALALYVPLVIVAYATYGRGVQSPMYETPEISELPMMRVIKAATILPMIFTYPLVLTPPEAHARTHAHYLVHAGPCT